MSYRDLLAEAARRRDAETRAQTAEDKLARIEEILDDTENRVYLEHPHWQDEHNRLYEILRGKS